MSAGKTTGIGALGLFLGAIGMAAFMPSGKVPISSNYKHQTTAVYTVPIRPSISPRTRRIARNLRE